jgi:hypothetical protein
MEIFSGTIVPVVALNHFRAFFFEGQTFFSLLNSARAKLGLKART